MNRRKKGSSDISEGDSALWDAVTKGIRPLKNRPVTPPLPKNRANRLKSSGSFAAAKSVRDRSFIPDSGTPLPVGTIDRRSRRRLSRGHMQIDSTVDLHGLTQDRALHRLRTHLEAAVRRGERCVLIVTGKGGTHKPQLGADPVQFRRRDAFNLGSGVLRRMVPIWLSSTELSHLVYASGPAADGHGGDGALYVLLRKREQPARF